MLNLDRFLQRSSSSRIIPSRLDITSCLRRRICRFSITSDSILTGITHKLAKNIGGKMNMVVLIDNPRGPKMVLLYGPPRGLASQVCNHLAEMVLLYAPPPHVATLSQKNYGGNGSSTWFSTFPHSCKHFSGNSSFIWLPTWPRSRTTWPYSRKNTMAEMDLLHGAPRGLTSRGVL